MVLQQRLNESLLMTRSLFYSSATIKAADFLRAGKLTEHEKLRDSGLLQYRDTLEDLADDDEIFVFVRHQPRTPDSRPYAPSLGRVHVCHAIRSPS